MKTIKSTIIALLLVLVLVATVSAQSATTLGRWVQSQSAYTQRSIGCDLPVPYSLRCWQHITVDGKIIGVIHYKQEAGRIVVWRERLGR